MILTMSRAEVMGAPIDWLASLGMNSRCFIISLKVKIECRCYVIADYTVGGGGGGGGITKHWTELKCTLKSTTLDHTGQRGKLFSDVKAF